MYDSSRDQRPVRLRTHFIGAFVSLFLLLLIAGILASVAFLQAGPVLERSRLDLAQSIRIVDRDQHTLYQFANAEDRLVLPAIGIPTSLRNAVVAIEDERFYTRWTCIDPRALLRAFTVTALGERVEGASTITQQLTRLLYLSPERTVVRKLREIMLSCRLEHLLTRDEILSLYLNAVSFGNGINGAEEAARRYFGIRASDLTIAESAVLAALPQRPTAFNPYGPRVRSSVSARSLRAIRSGDDTADSSEVQLGLLPRLYRGKNGMVRIDGRADLVLRSMLRLGFIDDRAFAQASADLLSMTFQPVSHPITAPHFALQMRDEVASFLASLDAPARWESSGLTVRTTLDSALQNIAEEVIRQSQNLLMQAGAHNVALIALDRQTREVVAYVGNNDFFAREDEGQIDMARVPRQPGSSFKPLIYAAAFERGYTPETIVRDEPIQIGTDVPKNYGGGFRGPMRVSDALGQSRNIPAIRTFLDIGGEDVVLPIAARAGVLTPLERKQEAIKKNPSFSYGWPLAIGSAEVPLLEMVQLYATIADHGLFRSVRELCSITDAEGKQLFSPMTGTPVQAIDPQAADWVDEILRDESSRPEGVWRATLTIPGLNSAAKTGTSNVCYARDSLSRCTAYGVNNVWTLGYTDRWVVGVWAGNADNSAMEPLADGLTVAAPIWRTFLEQAASLRGHGGSVCE